MCRSSTLRPEELAGIDPPAIHHTADRCLTKFSTCHREEPVHTTALFGTLHLLQHPADLAIELDLKVHSLPRDWSTSLPGTDSTVPFSNSSIRRSASAAHSSSYSRGVSTLAMSFSPSLSRSSGGRCITAASSSSIDKNGRASCREG